jgi:nucleoside 2-deoxyribosyltransferase
MKAYLAGPDVFFPNAIEHFKTMRNICEKYGLIPLVPLDNEVNLDAPSAARTIYLGNLRMIRDCDLVIANISPFRGPHADPGTAFEIGVALALNKPVFLYSQKSDSQLIHRMKRENSSGQTVENFGLTENLMLVHASNNDVMHTFTEAVLLASMYASGKVAA